MKEDKECATAKEAPETRERRMEKSSKFFEDHGLKRPVAASGETRGVGSLAMEREASEAHQQKDAAGKEARQAGREKEADALEREARDRKNEQKWTQDMRAINFNEPVERKTLEAGTVLYRNEIVRAGGGTGGGAETRMVGLEKPAVTEGGAGGPAAVGLGWFCGAEASPRWLGMVREGGTEKEGNRFSLPDGTVLERKAYVATRDVEALESTASDICGFRSDDRSGLLYFGGDRQLCVSDRSAMKPLEGMSLAEEIRLRLGKGRTGE